MDSPPRAEPFAEEKLETILMSEIQIRNITDRLSSLELEQGTDGSRLVLDWHETGGPTVAKPDRTGFGSRLIKRGLGTPGSRTEIDYAPAGLHCRLEGILCP